MVAGTIEHSASVEILDRRCDKVLTVFTPSFLKSRKNKLYTDIAQFLGVQRQRGVIIPIMFKYCPDLPPSLDMISKLAYDPKRPMLMFYERLFKCLGVQGALPERLLKYPEPFAHNSISNPNPEVTHTRCLPAAPVVNEAINDGFTDLSTMSTTVSELDTVATTVSELSVASSNRSLLRQMPDPPTHEPRESASSSRPKRSRNPIKAMSSLFKTKAKYAQPN